MNIADFCELFYASQYMPIVAYADDGSLVCAYIALEYPDSHYWSVLPRLLEISVNPGVYSSPLSGTYGIVRAGDGYIIIGPALGSVVNDETVHNYMHENAIPKEYENEVGQFLSALPKYSYNQFLNLLAYIHFALNGEKIFVPTHFRIEEDTHTKQIAAVQAELSYQTKESRFQHGTYHFEQQMLDYVKRGETEKLKAFLLASLRSESFKEGKLADNPLRQAKNLLIGLVTLVGKEGAIKGGLDVEQTYQLIDAYIQECESLQSLDAIKAMQYNVLIDFTSRVAQNKIPSGLSKEIFACAQYINAHTNESIGVGDVASHIGRSRAYIAKKFKYELGFNIGAFIMRCKLEEAKSLLVYSDKSISEISNYLCFSSQSYFQNVFKRMYGLTPVKYREGAVAESG